MNKPRWRAVAASRIRPGDTMWWRGVEWKVKRNYCHHLSPYAKMNLDGTVVQNLYTAQLISQDQRIWLKVYDPVSP